MNDDHDNAEPIAEESLALSDAATNGKRAPWLTAHRWKPGQSGNPSGRPGSPALSRRHYAVWVSNRQQPAPNCPNSPATWWIFDTDLVCPR